MSSLTLSGAVVWNRSAGGGPGRCATLTTYFWYTHSLRPSSSQRRKLRRQRPHYFTSNRSTVPVERGGKTVKH